MLVFLNLILKSILMKKSILFSITLILSGIISYSFYKTSESYKSISETGIQFTSISFEEALKLAKKEYFHTERSG